MSRPLPELVRFLAEDLKCRLRARSTVLDFEVFVLDLSGWKLHFSDAQPVIWIEERHLQSLTVDDLVAAVQTLLHNRSYAQRLPILLVEGRSHALREAASLRLPVCAVLDEEDVRKATAKPTSERRLLELLTGQLPLALLSPYEISSPVTGSRFFGREYEIRTILGKETHFAVVGVRRIGKSSLLLELKRRMEEVDQGPVYFFDCSDFHSAEEYIKAVATEVDVRKRERMSLQQFPNFLRLQSHKGRRPLTFLLDEVDHLLEFDRPQGWPLLDKMRSSGIQGFCRYIMTGYRLLMDETLNASSPLYNFVTRQPIGNLLRDDADRLVTVPMENMGVSFERRSELLGQIFRQTAGHPNYVQFYCHSLVQLMDRTNRRQLQPQDLASVHTDPEFERYIFLTFAANTSDLEKAIVYAAIVEGYDSFTARAIDTVLKKRRVFLTATQIDTACDRLLTACVLEKQGQAFGFAIPILSQLLKDHYDVEYMFNKAREDGKLAR